MISVQILESISRNQDSARQPKDDALGLERSVNQSYRSIKANIPANRSAVLCRFQNCGIVEKQLVAVDADPELR